MWSAVWTDDDAACARRRRERARERERGTRYVLGTPGSCKEAQGRAGGAEGVRVGVWEWEGGGRQVGWQGGLEPREGRGRDGMGWDGMAGWMWMWMRMGWRDGRKGGLAGWRMGNGGGMDGDGDDGRRGWDCCEAGGRG